VIDAPNAREHRPWSPPVLERRHGCGFRWRRSFFGGLIESVTSFERVFILFIQTDDGRTRAVPYVRASMIVSLQNVLHSIGRHHLDFFVGWLTIVALVSAAVLLWPRSKSK
jgi:hypothetical protein